MVIINGRLGDIPLRGGTWLPPYYRVCFHNSVVTHERILVLTRAGGYPKCGYFMGPCFGTRT
jgi:hypothetical protein